MRSIHAAARSIICIRVRLLCGVNFGHGVLGGTLEVDNKDHCMQGLMYCAMRCILILRFLCSYTDG